MKIHLSRRTILSVTSITGALGSAIIGLTLAGCAGLNKSSNSNWGSSGGSGSPNQKMYQQFAPPPLPVATSQLVRNILETQTPGAGAVAPGAKKSLFFTWGVTGVSQIWKLDTPMSFPIQMTSGAEATTLSDFTSDGKYAVVSRDRGGEENPGLYLLPTEGGPLIEIYRKAGVKATYGWSTNDAETIFYTANDIKPDSFAIYAYSVPTGKRELIFSEPGVWFIADAWGDRTFLLGRQKGAAANEFWTWTRGEKGFTPVIGQNEDERYQVSFGTHPGEFFILANRLGKFRTMYYGKEGKLTPITIAEENEIDSFDIDHMRFRLYIQRNIQGRVRLDVVNPKTFDPVTFPQFDGADQVLLAKTSRLGRFISLAVESGAKPRSNYTFDWSTQKLTTWSQTGLPELLPTQFLPETLESYPAKDGTKIPMWVTRPAKCAKESCPVVVNFHGGPESQSRAGFNRTAQIFTSSGFVYVEPNVRGSSGYGKPYEDSDNGAKRLTVIGDVEDCAKFIKANWSKQGRTPKIGIMGGSYGGYLTQYAMGKYPGAYDAGVSIVGMSNLETFLTNTAPFRRHLRETEYGELGKDAALLRELSPITYVNQIKAPLMLIQGANDQRVPVSEAIQMHEALVKHGVTSPLIVFADEGHGARSRDNQVEQVGQSLDFFQKYLK